MLKISVVAAVSLLALFMSAAPGQAATLNDPQIAHNGTFVEYDHPTEGHVKTPGFPYKFSATPPQVYRGAPLTGEHTRQVLTESGFSEDEIDALDASGAVATEQRAPAPR